MGRHCAAVGCTNDSSKTSCRQKNISFHAFPMNDKSRLKKWLIHLRRKDFIPTEHSVICSEHFSEEDFAYQPFTNMRYLNKNAVPRIFGFARNLKQTGKPRIEMETVNKSQEHHAKHIKAFIGKKEKRCSKCGFVTYCLHILYNHKIKCRGQLLGHPILCSYCCRKFNFFISYKAHKSTCVRKILRQKYFKTKFKRKHLKYLAKKAKATSCDYSFSCPICRRSFKSKLKFVSHLKKQKCTHQPASKKISFSARKSFNNKKYKEQNLYDNKLQQSKSKYEKNISLIERDNEELCCLWCKSMYPSKKLLFMHLEMSRECASAYHQSSLFKSCKIPLKARKTMNVIAKKSFPHRRHKIVDHFNNTDYSVTGSARKSLRASSSKLYNTSHFGKSDSLLNQCPVCYKGFPDSFTFFQHQKMKNHWGKATKSSGTTYNCPFCSKQFFHLKSRNAHLLNHSDKDENDIKDFLKSITCYVCLKTFSSELVKQQHMRIEHGRELPDINRVKYSASGSEPNTPNDSDNASKQKMSSVPSSVKKKLKQQPNTCPVCSKAFSHTVLRNKHFNEIHLKIFECQFCNTKFKSISSLSNHIQISHGKTVECAMCKMMFSNEMELLEHALEAHPNLDLKSILSSKLSKSPLSKEKWQNMSEDVTEKSTEKSSLNNLEYKKNLEYYCDVCDIGYQKLCGLQRHRQSKLHKDTLVKNLDAVQKSLSDVPSPSPPLPRSNKHPEILTCSECSEDFTNIKDFVPHRLSHFSVHGKYLKITELNPYMCEICSDVLDSHSKVQVHLFWHLQIESTSNNNATTPKSSGKNDTIVPDRLSGQRVAKKSFSKQSSESYQEVVIGGVKKPLFTCESCNIGFTTKAHYNMHVRKLCRKKMASGFTKNITSENLADNKRLISAKESGNIVHCINCNCLFSSSAKHEQHKKFCVKCVFGRNSSEIVNNLDAIKSSLNIEIAVAGCVTCGAIFDNVLNIAGHLSVHQASDKSTIEDIVDDIIHCALCNCLFSLPTFKYHKDFCKIPLNCACKSVNSKHMNVLKSALELKCAVAGCVSCGLPFEDLETFFKHLTLHQTNQIENEAHAISSGTMNVENENSSVHSNASDNYFSDLAENSLGQKSQETHTLSNKTYINDHAGNSFTKGIDSESIKSVPKESESSVAIEELRNNFSQLLCLLVSDLELMEKLGFNKQLVDDVLINVLKQMGQEPFNDSNASDIDKLRKNIQILLDLCLKDQIMQVIGNGKTTDEMVIEALKIFAADDLSASEDASTVDS